MAAGNEKPRRFSDEELVELHQQVIDLTSNFDDHKNEEAEKFDSILRAVKENTETTSRLAKESRGIIQLQRDLVGTARIGRSVQTVVIWLTKWGAIGLGVIAAGKWLKEVIPGA
jgi:hypothetical protein